ncbi:MAG: PDZ domain-containing protein, partial [Actinomycetota bacterium]|nr:PDZ domain-containing protein [Actinomycetota bacterium]
ILGSAITISGTKVYPTTGQLSVTSVLVTDPDSYITGFDILYGWIDKNRVVLPRVQVYPEGESAAESVKIGADEMSGSQINATAAALDFLGFKNKAKLMIVDVNKKSNAVDNLQAGDQIISVNNKNYNSSAQIVDYLDQKKPGDLISIKVLRDSNEIISRVIKLSAREDGSAFIGINIQSEFDFPFDVKIKLAETGGSSGGLIFALGIVDKLTSQDLVRYRNIAGTGTITTDGRVGPIGGITEKIIGAKKAGVELFLTPIENCSEISDEEKVVSSIDKKVMKIVPVATLNEAISILKLPEGAKYPSCLDTFK